MTNTKTIEVVESLLNEPCFVGVVAVRQQDEIVTIHLPHLKWMLEQLRLPEMFSEGKRNRWLGFVQGALWAKGLTTIEKEKERNRTQDSADEYNYSLYSSRNN